MPRLRTTTALSGLLLAAGVAGTAWLSGMSAAPRVTTTTAAAPLRPRMLAHAPTPMQRPHGPALAVSARAGRHSASSFSPSPSLASASSAPASVEAALADAVPVSLRPLDSPMRAMPYRQLREHRGTLVLKVGIDGAGRVRQAALGASSGDAVLDDYALSSVYAWRFAVPVGHAEGLAGEVTLRFTGDDDRLAELR